jgi:hypothetical protein
MLQRWCVVGVALGLLAAVLGGRLSAADDKKEEKKGTEVNLGGMKSQAPGSWKEEEPANRMRLIQWVLPKAKGDEKDAEIVIFKGIGGSTKDNVDRWKKMFLPPDGKKLEDIAKVSEMKVGDAEVTYLDVTGTYLYKAQPFNPNAKAEKLPNYRMLGVVFETKNGVYHIRLVGPAATVGEYRKGFDEWLKAFK